MNGWSFQKLSRQVKQGCNWPSTAEEGQLGRTLQEAAGPAVRRACSKETSQADGAFQRLSHREKVGEEEGAGGRLFFTFPDERTLRRKLRRVEDSGERPKGGSKIPESSFRAFGVGLALESKRKMSLTGGVKGCSRREEE